MSIEAINWALKVEMKGTCSKFILVVLANYANEKEECFPSQKLLAERCAMNDRSVRRCLLGLENLGLIERVSRKRSDGTYTSDLYKLNINQPAAIKTASHQRSITTSSSGLLRHHPADTETGHEPSLRTNHHSIYPSTDFDPTSKSKSSAFVVKQNINTTTKLSNHPKELSSLTKEQNNNLSLLPTSDLHLTKKTKSVWEDDFEKFWAAYPKKIGKATAKTAYIKLKLSIESVLRTLSWQRNTPQWKSEGGKYIPYPATYLNQGRYEDEPYVEPVRRSVFVSAG